MIEIDGSEGGGQFLRTALSLSALTGESFEVREIRDGRPNPGLRPQHLSAVEVLAEVCDAEVSETAVGADSLTFHPGDVQPGTYEVDIGTAGSIMLLFDTVLPLAMTTPKPIVLTATGGTDVKWSPTTAHYRQVKLPLLRRFGLQAVVDVDRPGFYPAGGGEATLRIGSTRLSRLTLSAREVGRGTQLDAARVYSLSSADLAESNVAARQAKAAVDELEKLGLPTVERDVRYANADSPGSAIAIRLEGEGTMAGFDALGEPGKPAEDVASEAVEDTTAFVQETTAAVDRHTADQLLVFLGLAGGEIAVPEITDHITASRTLLSAFGFDVDVEPKNGTHVLTVDDQFEFEGG